MPEKICSSFTPNDSNVITGAAALYKYRPAIVDVINTLGTNSRTAPFLQLVEGTGLMVELRSWVSNANVAGSSLYRGEYILKPLLALKQSFIKK